MILLTLWTVLAAGADEARDYIVMGRSEVLTKQIAKDSVIAFGEMRATQLGVANPPRVLATSPKTVVVETDS